jgi:hypothetical protein
MPCITRPGLLVALIVFVLCGTFDTWAMPRSWLALTSPSAQTRADAQAIPVDPFGSAGQVLLWPAGDGPFRVTHVRVLGASTPWLSLSHPVKGMPAPRFSLRI